MVPRGSRSELPAPALVRRGLLALLLVFVCGAAAAEPMQLEVITLRHRLVGDVLPVLEPLLAPGGTLSGMNDRLIVKTTPSNLEALKRVLETIDTRLRRLKITVRQEALDHAAASGSGIEAEIGGTVTAGTRAPRPPGGAGVDVETPDGAVRYRTYGTESAASTRDTHVVRTVEGEPAFIQTGESVPLPAYGTAATSYGAVGVPGVEYRDVASGVYVTPRLQGDNVVLDVSPRLERRDPDRSELIDSRRIATSVTGRLGEWIPLGGASRTGTDRDETTLASTRRLGDTQYGAWVKVEADEP